MGYKHLEKKTMEGDVLPVVRIGHLNRAGDIAREMQRLYRRYHHVGDMDAADLMRMGNFLNLLLGVVRTQDLEEKLIELEELINNRRA